MASKGSTTISWKVLYDQSQVTEKPDSGVEYEFGGGRSFVAPKNPYAWSGRPTTYYLPFTLMDDDPKGLE